MFAHVPDWVDWIVAVILMLVVVYLGWRWGLLRAQSTALQAQNEIIEALERKIKQLQEERVEDQASIKELADKVTELEGEVKGQRDLAKAIVEVVGESRVCLSSPECVNRVIPTI